MVAVGAAVHSGRAGASLAVESTAQALVGVGVSGDPRAASVVASTADSARGIVGSAKNTSAAID